MTELKPKKIDLSQINGGNEYKNGDGVGAEAINAPIKASAYAQALATNQPQYKDTGANYPTVSIEEGADGTPHFVFKDFGGAGGSGTVFVDTQLSETSENPVQNKVVTQALREKATKSEIPTKTSQLQNDSNFATQKYVDDSISGIGGGGGGSSAKTFSLTANVGSTYNESLNKGYVVVVYINTEGEIKEEYINWTDESKTINGIVKILNLRIFVSHNASDAVHAYSSGSVFWCRQQHSTTQYSRFTNSINIETSRTAYLADIYTQGHIVIDFGEIYSDND